MAGAAESCHKSLISGRPPPIFGMDNPRGQRDGHAEAGEVLSVTPTGTKLFLQPPPQPVPHTHALAHARTHTQRSWVYFIFSLVKICVRAALLSKPAVAPRINMRSEDRKLQAKTLFVSPIAA